MTTPIGLKAWLVMAATSALMVDAPPALALAPLLALALDLTLARATPHRDQTRHARISWTLSMILAVTWQLTRDPDLGLLLGVTHAVLRAGAAAMILARTRPNRPYVALFAVLSLTYLSLVPHVIASHRLEGDEPYYLLLAQSLLRDRDVDLANNYAQRDSLRFHHEALAPQDGDPDNGARSRHDPLLPILLLPGYAVGGRAGAMAIMAVLAAALVALAAEVGGRLAQSPTSGLVAGAILGSTGPVLFYALQIWTEVPAGLFALWLFREAVRDAGPRPFPTAVAALLLTLLKIRFGLVALPLVAIALLRSRAVRGGARRLALPFAAGLTGILGWNLYHYGTPFRMHGLSALWIDPGYIPTTLAGIALDQAYGLLPYAPYALIAVFGFARVARSHPVTAATMMAAVAPYLFVLLQRTSWFGEWSPPVRYPFVTWALCMPLVAPGLAAARRGLARVATLAAVIASLLTTIILTIQPGLAYSVNDGTSQLANRVAVVIGADLVRLLPSYKNPTTLSWWAAAVTLLIALLLLWRGFRADLQTTGAPDLHAWLDAVPGAAVAVAALVALVITLARYLPTANVELEQRQVSHDGGRPEPDLYTFARARIPRTGWLHPAGVTSRAPVRIAAGRWRLAIVLKSFAGGRATGRIRFGDADVTFETVDSDWSELSLDATSTVAATTLTLANDSAAATLVVDRIALVPAAPSLLAPAE